MIDLYYWPTPNGHKITMFLRGSRVRIQNSACEYFSWRSI